MTSSCWFLFHKEVDKQVKFFLENKINEKSVTVNATNNVVKYYKLPYTGHISTDVKRKIKRFRKFYCKSLNIKVCFNSMCLT